MSPAGARTVRPVGTRKDFTRGSGCRYRRIPRTEPAMANATDLLRRAIIAVLAGLTSASVVAGGGAPATESAKRSTSSFNLVVVAPPRTSAAAPSMGVGIPTRPQVSNPYQVPLIQNAGSLGSLR